MPTRVAASVLKAQDLERELQRKRKVRNSRDTRLYHLLKPFDFVRICGLLSQCLKSLVSE